MSEWWTYRLSDFLLFSSRVYFRQFELHNQALWPWHGLALTIGIVLLFLVMQPTISRIRMASALLGILWIWIGCSFIWQRYAAINWAAYYWVPLFFIQGALHLLVAARRGSMEIAHEAQFIRRLSPVLVFFSLIIYPLISPMSGKPWQSAELFGIAPDPTALATLGTILFWRAKPGWILLVIPALWCIMTAATLWTLGEPNFFIAPGLLLIAIAIKIATANRNPDTTKN